MQYNANEPIWLQVMDLITTDIVTGALAPGEKLPGGRDMAVKYSINPNTANRVYRELEDAGLVETRRGTGTYVICDARRIGELKTSLAEKAAKEFKHRMMELGLSREEIVRLLETED
ncbi:MAG: GntR family transcriptional regulator [Clostridiales bacterium]|nr:GntR family transcriptional regulator [Clostridiales bacterium]